MYSICLQVRVFLHYTWRLEYELYFNYPQEKKKKKKACMQTSTRLDTQVFFFFFFDMSTQEKREGRFKLVISTLLGVVHNRLSYPLRDVGYIS
jgi:hypothetical protein